MAKCSLCGRQLSGFVFGRKICDWCKMHEAAQRGEVIDVQPVIVQPWRQSDSMSMVVTQAIFGINIAVFIGMVLSGLSIMNPDGLGLVHWGANASVYTFAFHQWWRLLTYAFLHGGIIHLGFNMWCLWSLGEVAERLYGRFTFACIYLLCGIGGGLMSAWWHFIPVPSVGASGAIFGIAGAVIASTKLGEFSNSILAQSVMRSLMAFVGYNVVFGLVMGSTDNACHFGGLLTGLLLGALVAKFAPAPKLAPRLVILAVTLLLLVGTYRLLDRNFLNKLGRFSQENSQARPALLLREGRKTS